MKLHHEPVLRDRVVELWASPQATHVVDGTVGRAGHSLSLLAVHPEISLLALDRDPEACEQARRRLSGFGSRARVAHASFADLRVLLAERGERVDGVLLDLGVSSPQIDDPSRGFSFRAEAPLDLRFDPTEGIPATEWLQRVDARELERVLREGGDVPRAGSVARSILERRDQGRLETTTDLRDAVGPARRRPGEPADKGLARVFQAIRMAVNDELGQLDRFLGDLPDLLAPGGRVVILSYHRGEDRTVKRAFREAARDCVCPEDLPVCACGGERAWLHVLTARPVTPTAEEIRANPRARSAKLRAAERIALRAETGP